MDRSDKLNKSINELFRLRRLYVLRCHECGNKVETDTKWVGGCLSMGCPECGAKYGEWDEDGNTIHSPIFHTKDDNVGCRVCGEKPEGRKRRYCSDYCKEIAMAVQRMFTWRSVRRRVIERDDHTCQGCGEDLTDETPEVDHIHPISDGGHPFDARNLITLCGECHQRKTHGSERVTTEDAPGLDLGDYLEMEGV